MAVIDLGTGNADRTNDKPVTGRIINLETGGFTEPSQPVQQPVQGQPKQDFGAADFFTGSERIAQTPELGELPEFATTTEGDTFKIAIGLLSTFDEKAQRDIIQESIPEAVFETTPDGSTIIEVPTESGGTRRSVLNRPGLSPRDIATGTAQVLSFVGPARLANLGKSLAQKVGIGAVSAGATEQVLQEVGVSLGREERDPASTAIAALTGGVAEAVVPAIQGIRGLRQEARIGAAADDIDQITGNIRAAQEAAEETGIPLFQAQQTGIPAQLEKQSFVAQLPSGTKAAIQGLREQNRAASDAVESFLGQIAPDQSVVTGPEKIRTAAQRVIENVKSIRAEKSSPIYNRAFSIAKENQTLVDIKPAVDRVSEVSAKFSDSGTVLPILNKVKKIIGGANVDEIPKTVAEAVRRDKRNTLLRVHNAKMEIDELIQQMKGKGNLGPTAERELLGIQRVLLDQMDSVSPSYREARAAFEAASPAVEKVEQSIIGKIANIDDAQLKQVSTKIFDPAQTNPEVVRNAKKAIEDVDPGAWNEIVRVELERRLGSIKSTQEAGTVENIPGQLFRAIFPNDKSTKVLMNSLNAEQKKNLKYIRTALSRARLGRPGGSQTAGREEIKRELRGGVFQSFRNAFRQPITTLTSTGEELMFNRRATALSKALFDPTWKAEMKNIRKFSPKSPAAGRAMTQLLNDIESTEPIDNGAGNADQ
jgi:hypothetical protein